MKLEYEKTKYYIIVTGRFSNGLVISGAGQSVEEAESVLWGLYKREMEKIK
jgi:hypothetical protein